MYVLDKLWQGKLSPNEQCIVHGSKYSDLRHEATQLSKRIVSTLSEDGKRMFQEYQDLREQMACEIRTVFDGEDFFCGFGCFRRGSFRRIGFNSRSFGFFDSFGRFRFFRIICGEGMITNDNFGISRNPFVRSIRYNGSNRT